MQNKILLINGPNLGNIGKREPQIYGSKTMDYVFQAIQEKNLEYSYFQSNHEGEIIDRLEKARQEYLQKEIIGLVLNAGAFTHTSLALADCLAWIKIPFVEVHISNTLTRAGKAQGMADTLRATSLIAEHSLGIIAGFGLDSYILAVDALMRYNPNTL